MPDQWGRPTFDDGYNIARGVMNIQATQQRAWRGEQEKQLVGASQKISGMTDEEALSFEPKTYTEHIATANRIKLISDNQANRQAIDQGNNQKALEAYKYSTAAFDEARNKYASGDLKGASEELVKIGQITNNPFKARPSEDGKAVEMYFTKDGEDQPGEMYPIEQALQVAQQHLNSDEFFQAHLQNREARKKLNEEALLKPMVFTKGKKELRAIRELDLNTNQVRWSIYDEKGSLHGGKPITDINQLRREGWKQSDTGSDVAKKSGEMTELQKRAQRKSRLEYVDAAIAKAETEIAGSGEELDSESKERIKIEAEIRYNQEVLRWTPVGRNKKSGEIMYKTPEGEIVNKYGQAMKAKQKSAGADSINRRPGSTGGW